MIFQTKYSFFLVTYSRVSLTNIERLLPPWIGQIEVRKYLTKLSRRVQELMLRTSGATDIIIINQGERATLRGRRPVYIINRINILPNDASGRKAQYGSVR